jgi:hypothetical protein
MNRFHGGISPEKFYKRRSQEKHHSDGWSFLASQPTYLSRILFEASAPCARMPDGMGPGLDFPVSGFHRFWATKPIKFRNQQSRTVVRWRPWFYLRLVAYDFFWLSERA